MKDTINNSLALSKLGLVNNKNICIKDMGTTFACVCDKCSEEFSERFIELAIKLFGNE